MDVRIGETNRNKQDLRIPEKTIFFNIKKLKHGTIVVRRGDKARLIHVS